MRAEESWAASKTVVTEHLSQAIITGTIRPVDLERKFGAAIFEFTSRSAGCNLTQIIDVREISKIRTSSNRYSPW
jgi:hypothetical protein